MNIIFVDNKDLLKIQISKQNIQSRSSVSKNIIEKNMDVLEWHKELKIVLMTRHEQDFRSCWIIRMIEIV